ncbi:MAG: NAD(P)H-dependent oxidoreductase subunit E [Thermodesulfobacteriota bacterium]
MIPSAELVRLDPIVDKYSGRARYLIPALKEAQDIFGYLPWEVQHRLAWGFGISPSRVYGVVTFYSFFTTVPRGRHTVRVCLGTACYVKGSKGILDNIVTKIGTNVGETSPDGRFTIEAVRCLGACGLAPAMLVDSEVEGNLDPSNAMTRLRRYY